MRYSDSYKNKGQRRNLISVLKSKGIKDARVLSVMLMLPRHWFMDSAFEDWAYQDRPFSIRAGQTISQPSTVAYQSELLQIKPDDKVLEVGTGSGYQSAVLHALGARVFTIERQVALFNETFKLFEDLNLDAIRFIHGDGYLGWPTECPFDKIIVTCGAQQIPRKLVDQLRWGGRMVIPVGDSKSQKMLLLTKDKFGKTRVQIKGDFAFVPFLQGTS